MKTVDEFNGAFSVYYSEMDRCEKAGAFWALLHLALVLPDISYVELGRRLRESPGVQSAGAVTGLPLASTRGDWGIQIEGRVAAPGERSIAADWQVVTPGYFEAIGVPLREGRTITGADRADTRPVIVVNESMARKYWPAGTK